MLSFRYLVPVINKKLLSCGSCRIEIEAYSSFLLRSICVRLYQSYNQIHFLLKTALPTKEHTENVQIHCRFIFSVTCKTATV